jgi:DNA (cytosine-5)-methyltransferase 1
MNAITLFSGIGGFDIALEGAGVTVDTFCEIDKNAQNILRRHFPNAKLIDDVRKVGIQSHERGSIDIICGGFPCQDVSIAGKRQGLAGERSGLWFEFARIIKELNPGWVIIENVPGLLSSNKGKDFAVILQWLVECGYGVCWRILDAQYFGLAQRRRRVFIVASLGNGRAAEILFEREGLPGNTPPSREAGEGIADTFTIRAGKEGGGKGYLGSDSSAMALSRQTQYLSFDLAQITSKINYSNPKPGDPSPPLNTAARSHVAILDGVANTITTEEGLRSPRGDGNDNLLVMAHGQANAEILDNLSPTSNVNHEQPIIAWEMAHASEAYRETQGGIAPTLQSRMGTGGNQVPMVGIRRLTPMECERLQGFPDGWTDKATAQDNGQSDSARYRQLGNAVAVPVVKWIVNRIVGAV